MKLAHRRAWLDARAEKFRKDMLSVYQQVRVLLLLLKHPRVRWYAKAVASGPILYVLSPIQLIPTFIPVIGQMDDLFVVWAGMKLVRKLTPHEVLSECERRAKARREDGESQTPGSVELEAAAAERASI